MKQHPQYSAREPGSARHTRSRQTNRVTDGLLGVFHVSDPAYKATATKGIKLKGRITFKQYEFLVGMGLDGDVVRKWSCHRASQAIDKLKNKPCGVSRTRGDYRPKDFDGESENTRPAT